MTTLPAGTSRNIAGDFIIDEHWASFAVCSRSWVSMSMSAAGESPTSSKTISGRSRQKSSHAAMEQARERWFELEVIFRRTGDQAPLRNLIAQIRGAASLEQIKQTEGNTP